ncbi:hypothetical protein AKJ57_05515 [candidate division MSBL1 archaeon SCGC-AAA259A05]|uniref:KEOPS complex subunit n=1 Tax=candidate division MSBL1 archaeon SCGC-AAA259A05 TaxID=1698259 RepID=A0A133U536_9EURY|nr:hypothetical protein AKJ57_05515 [candidate division MSBL1 archaeon SCGC-AAA259A05]
MRLKAKISCSYKDESISRAVASSIQPDNLDAPENVDIETCRSGREVKTKVKVEGEIETLLATLEDLLACTSTAEKMI